MDPVDFYTTPTDYGLPSFEYLLAPASSFFDDGSFKYTSTFTPNFGYNDSAFDNDFLGYSSPVAPGFIYNNVSFDLEPIQPAAVQQIQQRWVPDQGARELELALPIFESASPEIPAINLQAIPFNAFADPVFETPSLSLDAWTPSLMEVTPATEISLLLAESPAKVKHTRKGGVKRCPEHHGQTCSKNIINNCPGCTVGRNVCAYEEITKDRVKGTTRKLTDDKYAQTASERREFLGWLKTEEGRAHIRAHIPKKRYEQLMQTYQERNAALDVEEGGDNEQEDSLPLRYICGR
ncbi:hypothetical protein QFC22_003390 [Naganishia vaughanmartiniae]|uniref:Uncharacterized protein n=1 Tax=Naganishia vaughanmartiniae TaxID=1424756 RepID=A0ACC2X6J3_9TREE|nr:hypothetical protein QFC22_003390 [Naganishia vaughanmartiniae]